MNTVTLRELSREDIPAVQLFLVSHLNAFFQAGRATPAADEDVFRLRQQFIQRPENLLLCAWNGERELVATLAACRYDDRITELRGRYTPATTAEICRCYVDGEYRRRGIGRRMLAAAEAFCQRQGYNMLYLHTHHFLPGGYRFWLGNEFQVVMEMHDDWQLVHMEKPLPAK